MSDIAQEYVFDKDGNPVNVTTDDGHRHVPAGEHDRFPPNIKFLRMLMDALGIPQVGQKVQKIVIVASVWDMPKAYIQRVMTADSQLQATAGVIEKIDVKSVDINPDFNLKVEPR